MSKKVLDIDYQLIRVFHPFYSSQDTPEDINHDKYDIVMCHRDGIQDNFDYILKFIKKNTKIFVDIIQESGNLDDFIDYFDKLTKTYSDISFYLFVDSEFDFEFSKNVTCLKSYKLSILSFFESYGITHHDSIQSLTHFSIYDKENGFLSLNGSIRGHRVLLLLELLKNKFIDLHGNKLTNNEISMLLYIGWRDSFSEEEFRDYLRDFRDDGTLTYDECELLLKYENILPIIIDDEDGKRPGHELKKFYRKILNFVTENTSGFDGSDNKRYKTLTFTEKVWKPFKTHQIPILSSLPGSVQKLRELGFDLFDDFVDHSYDKESDHRKRFELAFKELQRLLELDCVDFYNKNKIRFIKNHNNIYKLKSEAYIELQDFMFKHDLV
jgi:hypothetical protein